MREDIENVLAKDPAARSRLEVFFTYPGLHALWWHRIIHALWEMGAYTFSRWLAYIIRFLTGIDIHPGAKIGKKVFIDHGMGVVIGETSVIGDNVTIYSCVTLGSTSLEKGKRHPTIEEDVVIGTGAKVLGNIVIGKGSIIGANSVVVKSVPPYSVVVGVPGQVIKRSRKDLPQDTMPDTLGISLTSVIQRLDQIEEVLKDRLPEAHKKEIHAPQQGVWQGEDFMI